MPPSGHSTQLGLPFSDLVEPWLGDVIMLGVDDTLARKRGLKIFGVGMHHDPLRSTRSRPITSWGLSWVSLGVIVRLPFRPDHSYYLPLLFQLYQNKTAAAKSRRTSRSRPELAVELLHLLCNHRRNSRFHLVGDSAYGGKSVLCNLLENCGLTSRLLPTARLYDPPLAPAKGRKGWPPMRGARLPSPAAMLIDSLVIIWFAREGYRRWRPADHAWYATKRHPSFAVMLAELKRRSIRGYILSLPFNRLGPRKLFLILENAVSLAA